MKRILFTLVAVICVSPSLTWSANRAGLVIQDSTGELITRCVEFDEISITVDELIRRSGFEYVISQTQFGPALCYLHTDGNANVNRCFEHSLGYFWNFFQRVDNAWKSAEVGIGEALVENGELIGFAFGGFNEVQLPDLDSQDVCGFTSTAGIVIDHSDGTRKIVVVDFPGETITGLQLLQRSGLHLITSETSFGTAICSIDHEGSAANNCFGDPQFRYWSFNTFINKEWVSSPVGAGDSIVRHGDILGFHFTTYGTSPLSIHEDDVFGQTSAVSGWQYAK